MGTITLVDATTGLKREFKTFEDELLHINRQKEEIIEYRKTDLCWETILLSDESPYLINGVRLGDSLAEVEVRWGALVLDEERKNVYRPVGSDQLRVELDNYGRVDKISGTSIVKGSEVLLTTDDDFEAAYRLGTKREYRIICNSGGPHAVKGAERVLGEYDLLALGYDEDVFKEQFPDRFKEMIDQGFDFDKVFSIELSFGYLSPEQLQGTGVEP
jgi:hypothetical protein